MKSYLYLVLCLLSIQSQAKVILWDLGGVLFEPDKIGVAFEVGIGGFLSHAFWDMRSPTHIQDVLFYVISLLEQDEKESLEVAGSAHGKPLPSIMCKWQAGTVTGQEIINRARPLIKKLYKYDYFDSKTHRDLIWRCIKTMFNPKVLADNVYPVQAGIKLLRESYSLKNKDGSRKHRQFVFSNWDHISFDLCKKEHSSLFSLFEDIVISGHIKDIKPKKSSFEYLIKTYNLDPRECNLIDDQPDNARAARKCGMTAVLIYNNDYEALRRDLKALGVIK